MATAMEEAFRKSGMVSEETIRQREQKRIQEAESKARIEKEREQKRHDELDREGKALEGRLIPFNRLWDDPKSHRFACHLVFSYVPAGTGNYAWTDEEFKEPSSRKCCICRIKLISKSFFLENSDQIVEQGLDRLRRVVSGEDINVRAEFVKKFGDVVLGVVSPLSSAAFCPDCYRDFYEWIERMLLLGSREMQSIITRRRIEVTLTKEEFDEWDKIDRSDREALGKFLDKLNTPGKRAAVSLSTMRK
jgi:hypothetical protein